MVANIEIAPTLLEMAGVKKPDHFDSESLLLTAKGEEIQSWLRGGSEDNLPSFMRN